MEQKQPKESFTKQAAKASWMLPFITFGVMFISNSVLQSSNSPMKAIIVGLLTLLLLTVGLILGIIGILGGEKHGFKATVLPGILGIIFNSVSLSLFLFIAFSAFQSTRADHVSKEIGFGAFDGDSYHNEYFGMTITIPVDWSIQDQESQRLIMEEAAEVTAGENVKRKNTLRASAQKSLNLFMVFKYPPGSPVDFNPGIACIAEKIGHAPGIQKGGDYLFHVRKLMSSNPQVLGFPKEIYPVQFGEVSFDVLWIERATLDENTPLRQEYYATVMDGYALSIILSFTSDEDKTELTEILDTLTFTKDL